MYGRTFLSVRRHCRYKTRFVSFMGENERHDLALLYSDRHYGKTIVLDMQRNKFAIIGADDLNEPGYLEHAFSMTEEIAEELRSFYLNLYNLS